jgi:hypothetical protein
LNFRPLSWIHYWRIFRSMSWGLHRSHKPNSGEIWRRTLLLVKWLFWRPLCLRAFEEITDQTIPIRSVLSLSDLDANTSHEETRFTRCLLSTDSASMDLNRVDWLPVL